MDQTKAELQAQEANLATHNTITLPAGMTADLIKSATYSSDKALIAKLAEITQKGYSIKSNWYIKNVLDEANKISSKGLTEAQRLELTEFTADLLNQIRSQLGTSPVVISQSSIDFANKVVEGYNSDNWDILEKLGHDIPAIERAAHSFGLNSGGNYYESAGTAGTGDNMNTAKEAIYSTITSMLFNDADMSFGHTFALCEIKESYEEDFSKSYLGISFDNYNSVHLLLVKNNSSTLLPGNTFNTKEIGNPNGDVASIRNAIQNLKTQLIDQNTKLDNATANVNTATDELNAKKADENVAQKALASVEENLSLQTTMLNNYQAQLTKAQQDEADAQVNLQSNNNLLSIQQTKLSEAKTKLGQLKAELAQQQTHVQSLQTVADKAQSSLQQANAKVATDKEALVRAQQVLSDAKANLAGLQQQLNNYENAPEILKQAQANLDRAKQVLKAKSDALDTANAELAASKHVLMIREIVLKNAKTSLAAAKKDLATKLATIKQAEGELELAKAALSKQQQKLATAQSAYKIAQDNLTKARELAKRFLTKHQNTSKASRDETSVVLHHGKSASNTVVSVPLVKSDKTQSGQMATLKSTAVDDHEAHAMAMQVGGSFNQKNYVKLSSPKESTSAMGNGVTELPQTDENTDNALMGLGLLGAVCATMFLIPRRKLTIR